MRKATFLTTNLVLGFPIQLLLRCLRRFSLFDYIFLIYPGDNSDIEGFCPLWLARTPLISRRPLIGGIITGKSRGLLLGVPNTAEEFRSNPETARIVMERVLRIQNLVGAKSVALAGRLPGVLERQGMEIKSPVVMGVKGTLFSVIETINLAAKKHVLEPSRTRIGIVGHSYGGKWSMFGACLWDKYACAVWSDPGIAFDETRGSINYQEPWYLGLDPAISRKPGLVRADLPADVLLAACNLIALNKMLGVEDRVAMTNRADHPPTVESNDAIYRFFEWWLKR